MLQQFSGYAIVANTVKLNNKKKRRRGYVLNRQSGKGRVILIEVWFKVLNIKEFKYE